MSDEQDRRITEAVERERPRLLRFIRRRVADDLDAEDVLQDVFFALVEAYQLEPIEQMSAWLFRVARNRITDLFRKKRPERLGGGARREREEGGDGPSLEDLLPSADAGPEAVYARHLLIEELADALDELPPDQRDVFLAHEVEGVPFRKLAATTGVGINTLLSRKHSAVRKLRERLERFYSDLRSE